MYAECECVCVRGREREERARTGVKRIQPHSLLDEPIQQWQPVNRAVVERLRGDFLAQPLLPLWPCAQLQQDKVQVHPRLVRCGEPDAQQRLRQQLRVPVVAGISERGHVVHEGKLPVSEDH